MMLTVPPFKAYMYVRGNKKAASFFFLVKNVFQLVYNLVPKDKCCTHTRTSSGIHELWNKPSNDKKAGMCRRVLIYTLHMHVNLQSKFYSPTLNCALVDDQSLPYITLHFIHRNSPIILPIHTLSN